MRRKWVATALVLAGLGAILISSYSIAQQRGKPVEVEATMLVIKKSPSDALGGINQPMYAEDYMSTQAVLIRSPAIVGRAIKKPNVHAIMEGRPEDAVFSIRDALKVQRSGDAKDNILTLVWTGDDAQKGRVILEAVMSAYQEFLDETYKTVSDRTLELIMEAKRTLGGGVEQAEQQWEEFRKKAPMTAKSGEQAKIVFATFAALEAKKAAKIADRAELEGRLAWLEKAAGDKSDTFALQLKINEWASRSGFDKLPNDLRQSIDPQRAYVSALKQELAENESIQKALDQAIGTERGRLQRLQEFEMIEDKLRNSIKSNRELFEAIVKRVQEVNLVKDFGGYEARIISPARVKTK